jgi:hypothetical protein
MVSGRVAQACDLFGITTKVGTPSFAFFAKGGSRGCWRKFVDHAAVYHKSSSTGSIASHPCKVRKDGAATLLVIAGRSKAWATRPSALETVHTEIIIGSATRPPALKIVRRATYLNNNSHPPASKL